MHDLELRIDRFIFLIQTLQILKFYVKLSAIQTNF
jgi:hypothetical protein